MCGGPEIADKCNMLAMRGHRYLCQQLLLLGLGRSDAVDDEPNTALGDDIGAAVAHLDVHHRLSPCKTKHGEDVDDGVNQPARHGDPLSTEDQIADLWVRLRSAAVAAARPTESSYTM